MLHNAITTILVAGTQLVTFVDGYTLDDINATFLHVREQVVEVTAVLGATVTPLLAVAADQRLVRYRDPLRRDVIVDVDETLRRALQIVVVLDGQTRLLLGRTVHLLLPQLQLVQLLLPLQVDEVVVKVLRALLDHELGAFGRGDGGQLEQLSLQGHLLREAREPRLGDVPLEIGLAEVVGDVETLAQLREDAQLQALGQELFQQLRTVGQVLERLPRVRFLCPALPLDEEQLLLVLALVREYLLYNVLGEIFGPAVCALVIFPFTFDRLGFRAVVRRCGARRRRDRLERVSSFNT